jgi:hypothetical protein
MQQVVSRLETILNTYQAFLKNKIQAATPAAAARTQEKDVF